MSQAYFHCPKCGRPVDSECTFSYGERSVTLPCKRCIGELIKACEVKEPPAERLPLLEGSL